VLIQKKKYGILDVIAVVLLCIGLIIFTLANASASEALFNPLGADPSIGNRRSQHFPPWVPTAVAYAHNLSTARLRGGWQVGIFYISLALAADAIIGNVQEKVMNPPGGTPCSNTEMVCRSGRPNSAFAGCNEDVPTHRRGPTDKLTVCASCSGPLLLLDGLSDVAGSIAGHGSAVQRVHGICPGTPCRFVGVLRLPLLAFYSPFVAQLPFLSSYGAVIAFSVSGYLGVSCVLSLVQAFGALTAVTGEYRQPPATGGVDEGTSAVIFTHGQHLAVQ